MPLNCQTDEILDSMLSLSRFTSLVRWQFVSQDFRPLRKADPAVDEKQPIILYYGGQKLYADDGWLWTGASDGTITIGWIVRDFAYAGEQWSYEPDTETPPWMRIDGLVTGVDLELTWFDDRRGTVIEKWGPFQGPAMGFQVPGTEENGCFGKSVAFLIQPVGMTPEKVFAELPNELIGQIDVQNPLSWHEERPTITNGQLYTYIARTRPEIPTWERTSYYYRWTFPDYTADGYGMYSISRSIIGTAGDFEKVTVTIERPQGQRVCGDIIHVLLW